MSDTESSRGDESGNDNVVEDVADLTVLFVAFSMLSIIHFTANCVASLKRILTREEDN